MKFSEFSIGMIFYTTAGAWKVTDKGTRTVIAINLERIPEDELFNGPPYPYTEEIFNEHDFSSCSLNRQ